MGSIDRFFEAVVDLRFTCIIFAARKHAKASAFVRRVRSDPVGPYIKVKDYEL